MWSLVRALLLLYHETLARYGKLWVAHIRRECRERFPCQRGLAIPTCITCVTHVPWCMQGSLTSGFIWSRWRGKRSRHSRRMRNPQFCVSGKRPILNVGTVKPDQSYHWIMRSPWDRRLFMTASMNMKLYRQCQTNYKLDASPVSVHRFDCIWSETSLAWPPTRLVLNARSSHTRGITRTLYNHHTHMWIAGKLISAVITMTSQWARWRLKSPASRLFTQSSIQAQIKENIKAPRRWPLCGEFIDDRWIPCTKGQ